jgi:hypothetical protein
MHRIKICPDCATEYFPHIETCADCGAVLLSPEENKKVQEEKRLCMEESLEDQAVIRKGDLKWMNELYNVLIDSGIPCAVHADTKCKKGCSGDTCGLLVSSKDVERANKRIEEYFAEIHPEIRASKEMVSQGKCPACGSPVGSNTVECPDCGLTLLIIEK